MEERYKRLGVDTLEVLAELIKQWMVGFIKEKNICPGKNIPEHSLLLDMKNQLFNQILIKRH